MMHKFIIYIKNLPFLTFVIFFVFFSIVLSESLIILQSLILYGEIRKDLLILTLSTTLLVALIILSIMGIVLRKLKSIEDELNRIKASFYTLLEQSPDFIYIKDKYHRFIFASSAFAKLTGYKSWCEIVGKTDFDIFPKEHADVYFKEEQDVILKGKEITNLKEPYYDTEGHLGWIVSDKRPTYNKEGEIIGLSGISKDISSLIETQEKLKILATHDQLSNLYNRRYFYDIGPNIISLAKRENTPLSVLMIDIDNFKCINDSYGHGTGDLVIKNLADILLEHTRDSDIVARIGGEEFVLLLANTKKESALKVAEKIRQFTEQQVLKIKDHKTISFTISIGVDNVNIKKEECIDEALARADKALYKAKKSGRNRVF